MSFLVGTDILSGLTFHLLRYNNSLPSAPPKKSFTDPQKCELNFSPASSNTDFLIWFSHLFNP